MRQAATLVLARHGVPELTSARAAWSARLAELEQRATAFDASVSWWDRAAIFTDSTDEAQRDAVLAEAEAARAALASAAQAADAAVARASEELPPLEIAWRVEALLASVRANPAIGLGAAVDEVPARELLAIADRVVAIWSPGLDSAGLVARLSEDTALGALARPALGPPALDPRLGFAPVVPDEVAARAANALTTSAFHQVRARFRTDASQHAALAAHLRELRKSLGTFDLALGKNVAAHHEEGRLEAALASEERELIASTETLQHAILGALGAFAPLRIALAAHTAAGVLRARLHGVERVVSPATGALEVRSSPAYRALFLAALVHLRRAVDEVFEGVGALVSGRGGARDREALQRARVAALRGPAGHSPYRQGDPSADAAAPPPPLRRLADEERRLGERIDAQGAAARRDRALAHAGMLGAVSRWGDSAGGAVRTLDRLAFWSESEGESAAAQLEQRARWHRGFTDVLVREVLGAVAASTRGIFVLDLRDALVRVHVATEALATKTGSSSSSMSCPVFHHGEALAAVDALASVVGSAWGLRGSWSDLLDAVEVYLRSHLAPAPSPRVDRGAPLDYEGVVALAGEALRGHGFPEANRRLAQAHQEHAAALRSADQAEQAVTFLDQVNVFTTTPAEAARDACNAHVAALREETRTLVSTLSAMLSRALTTYPPARLYFELAEVRHRVAAVRAVLRKSTHTHRVGNTTTTRTSYRCEILGKTEALASLRAWTRASLAAFGSAPPDGELLARHWARPLDDDGASDGRSST